MKIFYSFFLFVLLFSFYNSSYAQDSLTIKQQLDRIMEEVKDLNKAVFNKSFNENEIYSNEDKNDVERFTSIDIRIYDLEKDIKNLTLQFEDVLFKLEDLSNEIISLESKITSNVKTLQSISDLNNNLSENNKITDNSQPKDDKSLGSLVLTDSSDNIQNNSSENSKTQTQQKENEKDLEFNELSSEEQLQFALDQMMKKNYDYSKKILEDFIIKYPENQLSGSAHFWLGKIFLFEKDFRKAAIIFGEGVQKFPKSIKTPEMYYELAKSLKSMDKDIEACKTLSLLEQNHEKNKFSKDPEKIKIDLNCS